MFFCKKSKKPTVTKWQKISLGLGDLGYGMVNNTMSSYIMYFGNTVMGVPGTLMGVAVALGTMWDAITDPLIGYISDNARTKRYGGRHIFILIGIILIAVSNVMLWSVPEDFNDQNKFIWFSVIIVVLETGHTLFATPSSALSIEISSDYNERASIQGYKSVFAILGILIPTIIMSLLQQPTENYSDGRFNPEAYIKFAYISGFSIVLLGAIMLISTKSHIKEFNKTVIKNDSSHKRVGIFKAFFSTLKTRSFRSVILGYSVAMMSATIIVTVGFNVFTFTFKTDTIQMYVILAGLFVMTIISQPVWMHLSKVKDKRTAMLMGLSVALFGAVLLTVMFVFKDKVNAKLLENKYFVFAMLPPMMVSGFGVGVLFSLPLALIGDAVVINKAVTGDDKTATYTGFMTLAYKASQSISQLILGILLDTIGFLEGAKEQPPKVQNALGWIMCVGILIALIGGLIIFSRYDVSRKQVEDALNKLKSDCTR